MHLSCVYIFIYFMCQISYASEVLHCQYCIHVRMCYTSGRQLKILLALFHAHIERSREPGSSCVTSVQFHLYKETQWLKTDVKELLVLMWLWFLGFTTHILSSRESHHSFGFLIVWHGCLRMQNSPSYRFFSNHILFSLPKLDYSQIQYLASKVSQEEKQTAWSLMLRPPIFDDPINSGWKKT